MRIRIYAILFMFGSILFSQKLTISGTVEDSDGLPIKGASVLLNGSGNGTVTNQNGSFQYSFESRSDTDFIEVSAEKFNAIRIEIGTQRIFNIILESVVALDDIVITSSYGTSKLKEEVVGAISTLNSDEIQIEQSFESFEKMIEGQVSGLLLTSTNEIGTPTEINIRGQGSLTPIDGSLGTSTQPLFIVDGVVLIEDRGFDDELFDGDGTFGNTFLNPLTRIPPEQIESVSVLKDAAAVGIYGADAANGVIIITTKKGKKGNVKFNAGLRYGVSKGINKINYLNATQYAELYNSFLRNSNLEERTFGDTNVDWFDVLNKTGSFNQANFSASGATNILNYRVGINYQKTDEAQISNEFTTWGANANIGFNFNKLSIQTSTNFSQNNRTSPNDYFNFILAPTFPIFDENGDYSLTGTNGIPNPLAAIEQNIDESEINSLIASINLQYDINPYLNVRTIFGIDYSNKDETLWLSGANESGRRTSTFDLNGETFNNWGRSLLRNKDQTKWNWSSQLYFDKNFGTHHVDALLGLEVRSDKSKNTRELGVGYINFTEYQLPSEADNTYTFNRLISEQNGRSLFSQLNYDFKKKYFFSGNIRRDESSAFGSDRNVAWNGGIGASWVISKENFMSSLKSNVNFLRLRASWGIVGNSRIGSFRSSGLYQLLDTGFDTLDTATPDSSAPPNNNLGWEVNEKWNFGLDINLFNFLNITLDYFRDERRDLIVSREVPLETGYARAEINGASMINRGLEVEVRTTLKRKNFNWTSTFTLATLENEITDLTGLGNDFSTSERARAQRIGSSTSAIWGFNWVGVDPATGRNLFNVDGQILDDTILGDLTDQTDWVQIGDSNPDVYGGWSNQFLLFKHFTFSFLINYKWGQDVLLEDELINDYNNLLNRNLSVNALDYWTQPGDIAINPIPVDNLNNVNNSDRYLFDETYIKLQSISVGYNFEINEKQTMNLFVNVTNLGYWYRSGNRPDRNGVRELRFTYPEMRTITIGANFNF